MLTRSINHVLLRLRCRPVGRLISPAVAAAMAAVMLSMVVIGCEEREADHDMAIEADAADTNADAASDAGAGDGVRPADDTALASPREQAELPPEVQALLSKFPPVEVEPSMLDFGDVSMRRPAVKTVRLTNTSDQTLHMAGFRSTCRCARPHVADRDIGPNSFIFVPIQLDSEGRSGERSAVMTIMFEGYEQPVRFNVRGTFISN